MTITQTVGVGGDFTSFRAAIATLFFAGDPGTDYEFDVISDIVEPIVGGATILKFFNRRVTVTCSHNKANRSNQAVWYTITQPGGIPPGATHHKYWANTWGFTLNFEFLKFMFTLNVSELNPYIAGYLQPGTPLTQHVFINVDNCIFLSTTTGSTLVPIWSFDTNIHTRVTNCLFKGITAAVSFYGDHSGNSAVVENCSLYECNEGFRRIAVGTPWLHTVLRNVVSVNGVTTDYNLAGLSGAAIINCADSDGSIALSGATLTDNITLLAPDNEFESVDSFSSDFLKLARGNMGARPTVDPEKGMSPLQCKCVANAGYSYPAGNQLPMCGIASTLNLTDLAGEPYGKWGDYPIGAYNAEVAY